MTEAQEIVESIEENLSDFLVYYGEVLLKDWGDNSQGASAAFWLDGERHTHPLKGHKSNSRNPGGSRFMMMLVEVADDNTIINQQAKDRIMNSMNNHMKGGAISKRAGILCKDQAFHQFLKWKASMLDPGQKHALSSEIPHGLGQEMTKTKFKCLEDEHKGEQFAKHFVYWFCSMHSRRELDYRPKAAQAWMDLESEFVNWGASNGQ